LKEVVKVPKVERVADVGKIKDFNLRK